MWVWTSAVLCALSDCIERLETTITINTSGVLKKNYPKFVHTYLRKNVQFLPIQEKL